MNFGINKPDCKLQTNLLDIGARLFLSPRISCNHASYLLDMLFSKEISIERFKQITTKNITELQERISQKDVEIITIMENKRKEWESTFGKLTKDDYDYIADKYLFTQKDLFGTDCTEIKSAREMASIVKEYIIGHDAAIEKISVPFFLHMHSIKNHDAQNIKSPILLIGPTGVGKSEIYKQFGRLCNCPIIRINSSEIVPSAWKGLHINDILARSINEKCNIEDLSHAIIIFHEFDKIVHYGQKRVSDTTNDIDIDLIRDIMCLFESGYQLHLENGFDQDTRVRSYELPVDNLMIVFDGAFYGIENIIRKRLNIKRSIGFDLYDNEKEINSNILNFITTDDLISWGYPPELMGRIGEYIVLNPLSTEIIFQIMTKAKNNILSSHINFCQDHNIKLEFTNDALYLIADIAYKSGLGFRNVRTLLSKCMNKIYYELYEHQNSQHTRTIYIDQDYVNQQLK